MVEQPCEHEYPSPRERRETRTRETGTGHWEPVMGRLPKFEIIRAELYTLACLRILPVGNKNINIESNIKDAIAVKSYKKAAHCNEKWQQ